MYVIYTTTQPFSHEKFEEPYLQWYLHVWPDMTITCVGQELSQSPKYRSLHIPRQSCDYFLQTGVHLIPHAQRVHPHQAYQNRHSPQKVILIKWKDIILTLQHKLIPVAVELSFLDCNPIHIKGLKASKKARCLITASYFIHIQSKGYTFFSWMCCWLAPVPYRSAWRYCLLHPY